jgi:dephospho-CoA kinase
MSDPRRPYLVGLTGGLASGKSTVARLLEGRGSLVVDADDVVAWLYESGRPGARAVGELFGADYHDTAGAGARGRQRWCSYVKSSAGFSRRST